MVGTNLEESQNADHEPPQEKPEVCIDNSDLSNKTKKTSFLKFLVFQPYVSFM